MTQTTLRDYLQTTEDAISSGLVNDAFAHCQYILTHFPDSLEAQRLLGEIYLAQGKLEEAQQTFDWVLTNDPENVVAYCSRALISERMEDYDTALDCYQQAYELSRGNSAIRQEFNQLSIKVGQQSFIFSRAGLARLYMRGDLLPQAIQEWEAVLSANPDRLDARTGLVETYWREGLYDRVEQLAHQILNDVPGCLKALLLLSHVTFAQNTQASQHLLERAEALDPDMVMAQELFSDFIASNPKDPFLALLKKAPSVFAESSDDLSSLATSQVTSQPAYIPNGNGKHHDAETPTPDQHLAWDNLNTTVAPQAEYQPMPASSPYAAWGNPDSGEFVPWVTSHTGQQNYQSQSQSQPEMPSDDHLAEPMAIESFDLHTDNFDEHATPEMMSIEDEDEDEDDQDATLISDPSALDQQPWHQMEALDTFDEPDVEQWNTLSSGSASSTWAVGTDDEQDSELPAPPAWLDMLTRGERNQPSGSLTTQVEPASSSLLWESASDTTQSDQADQPAHMSWMDQLHATPSSPSSPASPASPVQQQQEMFSMPQLQQQVAEQPLFAATPQAEQEEEAFFGPEWLKSLGAAALESPPRQEAETSSPTTPLFSVQEPGLEFYSEPLMTEPDLTEQPATLEQPAPSASAENWLDQMKRQLSQPADQHLLTTLEALENDLRSKGFTPLEPGALSSIAQDTTLSSALAHFGALEPVSQPADEVLPIEQPFMPLETLASQSTSFEPTPAFDAAPATDVTMPASISHPDFLDSELETTMKRPAVRLQPMQRLAMPPTTHQQAGKGRSSDYALPQKTDGPVNYKERLIRGYHYQLAGAYDDAMQEYRIIIRNAPELLEDVISNMRALLKLASKYSAGYRVLGDAYMRQGEYLQAMEAYNKALTMAKKAKG